MRVHRGVNDKDTSCDVCGREIVTSDETPDHIIVRLPGVQQLDLHDHCAVVLGVAMIQESSAVLGIDVE
jgi:hypothetical protein